MTYQLLNVADNVYLIMFESKTRHILTGDLLLKWLSN